MRWTVVSTNGKGDISSWVMEGPHERRVAFKKACDEFTADKIEMMAEGWYVLALIPGMNEPFGKEVLNPGEDPWDAETVAKEFAEEVTEPVPSSWEIVRALLNLPSWRQKRVLFVVGIDYDHDDDLPLKFRAAREENPDLLTHLADALKADGIEI